MKLKVLFGGKVGRRKFDNPPVELFVECALLNAMTQNVKPESDKVEICLTEGREKIPLAKQVSSYRSLHATKLLTG